MKNTTLLVAVVIIAALIGGFMFIGTGKVAPVTGQVISNPSNGEVQEVTLGMKNLNYYPRTIEVKAGVPVELTLDSSVQGCFRSFAVPDLGVFGVARTPSDTIKFTPNKKGTFAFRCSMGMGDGTLIVKE